MRIIGTTRVMPIVRQLTVIRKQLPRHICMPAPGTILGFVYPSPVDWTTNKEMSHTRDGVMAVATTYNFSHSHQSVLSTKKQQSYVYHHAGNRKMHNIELVDTNVIMHHHCLIVPHAQPRKLSYSFQSINQV
jgi:hypothetical protein